MSDSSFSLSRRRVDQAGDRLRRHRTKPLDAFALGRELDIVDRFRREWSDPPQPLAKINMGLRSMARTAGANAEISQRLKRVARIVGKLERYPTARLTQMQDIGGCRAVVPELAALDALRDRLLVTWSDDVVRVDDYTVAPRDSGYRAIHIVVRRDDHLVEVQLRSLLQHRWATAVERIEGRLGAYLREVGEGPPETDLREALRRLGDAFALFDRGEPVPEALLGQLADALRRRGGTV